MVRLKRPGPLLPFLLLALVCPLSSLVSADEEGRKGADERAENVYAKTQDNPPSRHRRGPPPIDYARTTGKGLHPTARPGAAISDAPPEDAGVGDLDGRASAVDDGTKEGVAVSEDAFEGDGRNGDGLHKMAGEEHRLRSDNEAHYGGGTEEVDEPGPGEAASDGRARDDNELSAVAADDENEAGNSPGSAGENAEDGHGEFAGEIRRREIMGVPDEEIGAHVEGQGRSGDVENPELGKGANGADGGTPPPGTGGRKIDEKMDEDSFEYGTREFFEETKRRVDEDGVTPRDIAALIDDRRRAWEQEERRRRREEEGEFHREVGRLLSEGAPVEHIRTMMEEREEEDRKKENDHRAAVGEASDWIANHGSVELKNMIAAMAGMPPELVAKFILREAERAKKLREDGFETKSRRMEEVEAHVRQEEYNMQKEASPNSPSTPLIPNSDANSMYTFEYAYQQIFQPQMEEYDWTRFDPYSFSGAPLGGWGRATRSRLATLPIRLVTDLDGGMDLLYETLTGNGASDDNGVVGGDENGRDGVDGESREASHDGSESSEHASKEEAAPTAETRSLPKDLRSSIGPHFSAHDATGQRYVCRSYAEDELIVSSRLDSVFRPAMMVGDNHDGNIETSAQENASNHLGDDDNPTKKKFEFSIHGSDGKNIPTLPEGVRDSVLELLRGMGMADAAEALAGQLHLQDIANNPQAFLNVDNVEVDVDVHVIDAGDAVGDHDDNANELMNIIKAAAVGANMESVKNINEKGGSGGSSDNKAVDPKKPSSSTPPRLSALEIRDILRKLDGLCSQLHLGWWSYEWCHEGDVRQFHVAVKNDHNGPDYDIEDVTLVGKFDGESEFVYPKGVYGGELKEGKTQVVKFDTNGNLLTHRVSSHTAKEDNKYSTASHAHDAEFNSPQRAEDLKRRFGHGGPIVRQVFGGGEYCPEAKIRRRMTVELRCCTEEEIDHWLASKKRASTRQGSTAHSTDEKERSNATPLAVLVGVQEDETCVYRSRVCTPLLCPKPADDSSDAKVSSTTATTPPKTKEDKNDDNPISALLSALFGEEVAGQAGQVQVFLPDDETGRAFDELIRQAEDGGDFINNPNFAMLKDARRKLRSGFKKLDIKDLIRENDGDTDVGEGSTQLPKPLVGVKDGESIREILAKTLGKRPCLTKSFGWWTYEFCHAKRIRQYHANTLIDANTGFSKQIIETEHLLGIYEGSGNDVKDYPNEDEHLHMINTTGSTSDRLGKGLSQPQSAGSKSEKRAGGNGALYVQEYTHGDVCDHEDVAESVIKGGNIVTGGVERSSTVRFACGKRWELVDVKEDSTCHYVLDVIVPELCQHELFRAPVTKTQVVKCLPV